MERITIEIETGNAAFEDYPVSEISRILRRIASKFEVHGDASGVVLDSNGNACGSVQVRTSK